MWKIEYDNDTGPDDEGFWESWTVVKDLFVLDGMAFECDSKESAEWLCALLNKHAGGEC
jgi:hypothetical protein